jgi:predicted CoA-binding protein
MKDFLSQNSIIAVVGVSLDPAKYGYKVFFDLLEKGYHVYAVHLSGGSVGGEKRYISLSDLPVMPDLTVVVTPPQETEKIVRECQDLHIKKIWFQPGSESEAAINFCQKNHIDYLANSCVIISSQETV